MHLPSRAARRPSALLVLSAGLFAAACLMAAPSAHASDNSVQVEVDDDGAFDAKVQRRGYQLAVATRGTIGYAADEHDVLTVSAGGEFDLREKSDGLERRMRITAARDGTLTRSYERDRQPVAIDGPARTWFAVALTHAFRSTGLDTEHRVARILASRGIMGLLDEVRQLDGDFIRRGYLAALFAGSHLDAPGMGAALDVAATLGSDFERAEALVTAAGRLSPEPSVVAAWRDAVQGIGSDFEKRRVLEATLVHCDRAYLGPGLDAIAGIASDFEKREALSVVAPRIVGDAALTKRYQDIAVDMNDFERNGALAALLAAQNGITL